MSQAASTATSANSVGNVTSGNGNNSLLVIVAVVAAVLVGLWIWKSKGRK